MIRSARHAWSALLLLALALNLLTTAPAMANSQVAAVPSYDDWPQLRGDHQWTGLSDSLLQPPLKVAWQAPNLPVPAHPPVVGGDMVFAVGKQDGTLYALSRKTGATAWSKRFSHTGIPTPPAYANGTLFKTAGRTLYALDAATGEELWTVDLGYNAYFWPTVAGERIYVATDVYLYALDLSGQTLWRVRSHGGSVVEGGDKLFVLNAQYASAFERETGKQLWRWEHQGAMTFDPFQPAWAEGLLLFWTGSDGGPLYALDGDTGAVRWQVDFAGGRPAIWNGVVYIPMANASIARHRLADGTYLGSYYPGTLEGDTTGPVIANGLLFTGALSAIHLETGEVTTLLQSADPYRVPEEQLPPVVAGDMVLALHDKKLTALVPETAPVRGTLSGRVTNETTGAPIPGAAVRLEGTARVSRTDADGRYSLIGPVGPHMVAVSAFGHAAVRTEVTLAKDNVAQHNAALAALPPALLAGKVVDAHTKAPVAGVRFIFAGDHAVPALVTDEEGRFRLEAHEGAYAVRIQAKGYPVLDTILTVSKDEGADLEVALAPYPQSSLNDWVTPYGGTNHTGSNASLIAPPLERLWESEIELDQDARPLVAEGKVFVSGKEGLYALSLDTGAELWRVPRVWAQRRIAYDRGMIYISRDSKGDAFVEAYDAANGARRWSIGIDQWGAGGLTAGNGRVHVIGSGLGSTLYTLDSQNGNLLWTRQLQGGADTPALFGDLVIVSSHKTSAAYHAGTGERLWFRSLCPQCSGGAEQIVAVGGGIAFEVESSDGILNAVDAQTGVLRWKRDGYNKGIPLFNDGLIYVTNAKGETEELEGKTGRVLRTLPVKNPQAIASGYLLGEDLTLVDLRTGKKVDSFLNFARSVTVAQDRVLAIDWNGRLVVFRSAGRPRPSGLVHGTVRDKESGRPVFAEVLADGQKVWTDPVTGAFLVRMQTGKRPLKVSAPRWQTEELTVTVGDDVDTHVTVDLTHSPTYAVSGRVTSDGQPLEGARVSVLGETAIPPVYAAADGTYELKLFPGSYTIRVEAPGRRTAHVAVSVFSSDSALRDTDLRSGPAGNCPMAGCTPGRTGETGLIGRPEFMPLWSSDSAIELTNPIIARGMVIAGTRDGQLRGMDLLTGKPVWSADLGVRRLPSPPAYGDGRVYVGNNSGAIFAFHADTGERLWEYKATRSYFVSAPIYEDGKLYLVAAGAPKPLIALDAATGNELWSVKASASPTVLAGGDGRLFTTVDWKLHAYDQATGEKLWEATGGAPGERWSAGEVIYADGVVLAVGQGLDDRMTAFDAATGERLWQSEGESPIVSGGVVYLASHRGLKALSLRTGKEQWSEYLDRLPIQARSVIADGVLIMGGGAAIDLQSRERVWSYTTESRRPVVAGEGFVVLQDEAGWIHVFRSKP